LTKWGDGSIEAEAGAEVVADMILLVRDRMRKGM